MSVRIGRLVLTSRDLDASAAFYADAFGFRTLHDASPDGFRLLHVGPGDVPDPGLWLFGVEDGTSPGGSDGAPALVLYVDDLGGTVARLAVLGVTPHVPVTTDATSGQSFAHVLDPDGHELVLVEGVTPQGGSSSGARS
ncbi:VOC family protein [Oerskovia turbata]|nr:VOC family protein [Oerskovia turbata]